MPFFPVFEMNAILLLMSLKFLRVRSAASFRIGRLGRIAPRNITEEAGWAPRYPVPVQFGPFR